MNDIATIVQSIKCTVHVERQLTKEMRLRILLIWKNC